MVSAHDAGFFRAGRVASSRRRCGATLLSPPDKGQPRETRFFGCFNQPHVVAAIGRTSAAWYARQPHPTLPDRICRHHRLDGSVVHAHSEFVSTRRGSGQSCLCAGHYAPCATKERRRESVWRNCRLSSQRRKAWRSDRRIHTVSVYSFAGRGQTSGVYFVQLKARADRPGARKIACMQSRRSR